MLPRVHENLEIVEQSGRKVFRCRCGYTIGPATGNYKEFVLKNESPVQEAGCKVNPYRIGGDNFVFREFCCPGCAAVLGTEVALKGAPLLWDIQLEV